MKKNIVYGKLNKVKSDLFLLELNECYEPNSANSAFYNKVVDQDIQSEICVYDGRYDFNCDNNSVITTSIDSRLNRYKLKELYKDMIEYAINNKYKSVATTLLYFSSYGHKFSDSLNAFNEVFDDINKSLKSDLTVTIVFDIENDKLKQYLNGKYCCDNNGSSSINVAINYNDKDNFGFYVLKENKLLDIINFFSEFNPKEAFKSNNIYYNPIDFLDDYTKSKYHNLSRLHDCLSKNECSKIRCGKTTLKKYKLLEIAYVLELNKSDFIQLLALSGYCLNPTDPLDLLFYDYYMLNKEFDENNVYFSDFIDRIYG